MKTDKSEIFKELRSLLDSAIDIRKDIQVLRKKQGERIVKILEIAYDLAENNELLDDGFPEIWTELYWSGIMPRVSYLTTELRISPSSKDFSKYIKPKEEESECKSCGKEIVITYNSLSKFREGIPDQVYCKDCRKKFRNK